MTTEDTEKIVQLHPERLDQPLRWRRPRRVFVNSLPDLFHDDVPTDYIARVFAVMALAPAHTFQVLTKRPARMRSLLSSATFETMVGREVMELLPSASRSVRDTIASRTAKWLPLYTWPLPNVWLGTSVEDQERADLRIPVLLGTPAAVRFLSCEPLLGPVTLPRFCACGCKRPLAQARSEARAGSGWLNPDQAEAGVEATLGVDWVIVGGESGKDARPMHPGWARSLRDQCADAGVPFHFKQWGEWAPHRNNGGDHVNHKVSARRDQYESDRFRPNGIRYQPVSAEMVDGVDDYAAPGMVSMLRVGKRNAGRELDGITHDGFPG